MVTNSTKSIYTSSVSYPQDQYTKIETTAIADFILTGDIDKLNTAAGLHNQSNPGSLRKILENSRCEITRDLTNILNTLEKCEYPKFMLIEVWENQLCLKK